ncbi:FAD/NAD(P)-binding protein [Actinosynnema sp. NPDC091369]
MRIGIVGGGASAVCVIDALARSACRSGTVTVFEPSSQLWRGRAYQKDDEVILVNSPAEDMSVRQSDTGHFERWLENRHGPTGGPVPEFTSRAVFGEYLAQTAYEGIARLLERNWQVEVVREGVTGAHRSGDQVSLHTDDGSRKPFDYVILAVGGGKPKDSCGLSGTPNFIGEPYPLATTITGIDPDDDVAVIGTGLTAVDAVVALESRGHRGRISMLSRLGVLPAVRQRPIAHELRHFVPHRIHDMAREHGGLDLNRLAELLRRELAEVGSDLDEVWDEITRVGQEPAAVRLRRQLSEVASIRTGMRVMQKAVHVSGPDLWPLLPEHVRKDMLGPYYRTLMSLCCPMPPRSAETLLRLMGSGQLQVLSGVQQVYPVAGGGFQVMTRDRELTAHHVVNGVSAPAHRIPLGARKLVDALCDEGLAVLHRDGGLCVRTSNSRLTGADDDGPKVYAIGDIAGGTFFFTFGIPSLVDRCHDIVTDIFAEDQHARAARTDRKVPVASS